jgi:RNA polymerase sigma-70 factor (ECF subfamily)
MNDSFRTLTTEFLADQHRLMAFIIGMLRDYSAAEDIFQETWLQLADAIEKGTEIRDVRKWSRGVARNLILKHWRSTRAGKGSLVMFDSELLDLVDVAFDEQDDRHAYWETRRRSLRECMAQLPPQSRAILAWKYEQRLPASAVAQRVNKTVEAVLMILSRLRKALAKCAEAKMEALHHDLA